MYIKRILRVLIPGVTVSVSNSRIFMSFVFRVPVSGDLGFKFYISFIFKNYKKNLILFVPIDSSTVSKS